MRTINIRLLGLMMLVLAGIAALAYGLQRYQVGRNAQALLREAGLAKERKNFDEAVDFLERYISLAPAGDVGPLADLALIQADLGRFGQAFRNSETVLRQDPARADVRRRLVDVAMYIGRYPDARHHIEVLLNSSPQDAGLLVQLARCQIAGGEYATANDKLEEAVLSDPSCLDAYSLKAALLNERLKKPAGALETLDKMIGQNAQNPQAYVLRGSFRLDHPRASPAQTAVDPQEGQDALPKPPAANEDDSLNAALADARQALQLADDDERVILFAVRCLIANDNLEEAEELARRGQAKYPKNAYMYVALSNLEAIAGHPDEAIAWLERGLAAIPKQSSLLWNLANLLVDAGRLVECQTTLDKLRATKYATPPLLYLESRIKIEEGEWLKASKRLEDLRPRLTEWPELLKGADFWMGRCYAELGQTDKQLDAFRRAAGLDSRWLSVREGIAAALLSIGRIEEALEEYRQIVDRVKKLPLEVLVKLARLEIMVNLSRNAQARNWAPSERALKRIEDADPGSVSAPILRAEILLARDKEPQAEELLTEARDRSPQTVEFWLALAALAERRDDWEQAGEIFDRAQEVIGDSVDIRLARAQYLVNRDQAAAKDGLRELAQADDSFSQEQQMLLFGGLAAQTLRIGDLEETERLCKLVAQGQPRNLRVRLLLFDLAFRANEPKIMQDVLDEVQEIEHSGPLWHYGEAVRLSVAAKEEHKPEYYAAAKKHLSEARLVRPAWSRIPLLLAQINELEGDEESAIANYTESTKLGERSPAIISHTVGLLYQRGRFLEADLLIRRLQEQQSPFSSEMKRLAAEVSLRLQDTVRGLDLVTKAAEKSSDPDDHVWAGRIFSTLGKSDQAEASFHQAIALDETSVEAWVGLIQHYGRTLQPDKADEALNQARQKISPAEAPAALARALESIRKIEEAETNYKLALAAAPDEVPMLRRLAEFYLRHGKEPDAKPLLSKILDGSLGASDSDRIWGRRNLALALVARGGDTSSTKEALALIDENLATQPKSQDDQRARAMVLAYSPERGARREAAEILEKILADKSSQRGEGIFESRFVLAQLYVFLDELPKAAGQLRSLVASGDARNPRYPAYLSYYVRFLLNRNEIAEASLWLPNLRKLAPLEYSTWQLVAEIEFSQQRYDELLSTIEQFAANPDVKEADRAVNAGRLAQLLETFAKRLDNTRAADEKSSVWAAKFVERAEALYQKYVEQLPQDALALAAFLGRRERHPESLDNLEKEWDRARPEQIAAVTTTLLGSKTATQADHARAVKVLKAALDKQNRPLLLVLALADLQNLWERFDEAEALYQEVLEKDPKNPGALNNLALLLALRGRGNQKSSAMIEKAISIVGPDPSLLDTRATISMLLGNLKSAAADLERAIAFRPSAVRFFHQAQVELKLGKKDAARESLERANALGLHVMQLHPLERPNYRQLQNELQ